MNHLAEISARRRRRAFAPHVLLVLLALAALILAGVATGCTTEDAEKGTTEEAESGSEGEAAGEGESGPGVAPDELGPTREATVKPSLALSAAAELLDVDLAALTQSADDHAGNFATLTVTSDDGISRQLEVESLKVTVDVEGRMARTTVEQVFKNNMARQMEGTYEFTLPEGAAISRLAMDVFGTMTEGELVERERAREIYESIVRRQKDPALLEWQGGNRFKTQIFPIPANGTKTVILAYEAALPEDRDGLRYVYDLPMLTGEADAQTIGTFEFEMNTDADGELAVGGYSAAVSDVPGGQAVKAGFQSFVPKGPIAVRFVGAEAAREPGEARTLIGTHQRLATSSTQGQRPAPEDFFALDFVPDVAAVTDGASRNLVVVLDTSAGIGDRVLEQSKLAALIALSSVPKDMAWAVVSGDYRVATCRPDDASDAGAAGCLKGLDSGGATDLQTLLERGVEAAGEMEGPTSVVLFSDGAASLGQLDGDVIAGVVEQAVASRSDLSFHTVAVGHAPAEDTMDHLARAGAGHSLRMTPADAPDAFAAVLAERAQEPVLSSVSVAVTAGDVDGLWPTRPTYLERGEALLVLGKLNSQTATVTITGRWDGEPWEKTVELARPKAGEAGERDALGKLLSNFWARASIADMHDRGEDTAAVVDFSLDYGVMSPYTSFLVLENEEAYKRFEVERRKEAERVAGLRLQVQADGFVDSGEEGKKRAKNEDTGIAPPPSQGNLEKSDDDLAQLLAAEDKKARAPRPSTATAEHWDAIEEETDEVAVADNLGLGTSGTGSGGGGEAATIGFGGKGSMGRGIGRPGEPGGFGGFEDRMAAPVSVRHGTPAIAGPLSRDEVENMLAGTAQLGFMSCDQEHQTWEKTIPTGAVTIRFEVAADGTVGDVGIAKNALGSKPLAKCIKNVFARALSGPAKDEPTTVEWTLVFIPEVRSQTSPERLVAAFEALDPEQLTVWDDAAWIDALLALEQAEDAEARIAGYEQRHAEVDAGERVAALVRNSRIAVAFPATVFDLSLEALRTGERELAGAANIVATQLLNGDDPSALVATLKGLDRELPVAAAAAILRVAAGKDVEIARQIFADWRETRGNGYVADAAANIPALAQERLDALIATFESGERPMVRPGHWQHPLADALQALRANPESALAARVEALVIKACVEPGVDMNTCNGLVQALPGERTVSAQKAAEKARLDNIEQIRSLDVGNATLINEFASALRNQGRTDEANRMLSEIVEFGPHDYQMRMRYVSALKSAQATETELCREYGVAVQLDPRQRDHFRDMMALRRNNEKADTDALRECIVQGVSNLPVNRAISMVLTWEDPTADIDLHVHEVGGEEVWYQAKESSNGGLLYYDILNGYGPEIYVLGSGPKGTYKVSLVYYGKGSGKVNGTLTILRNAGSRSETRQEIPFTLTGPDSKTEIDVATVEL